MAGEGGMRRRVRTAPPGPQDAQQHDTDEGEAELFSRHVLLEWLSKHFVSLLLTAAIGMMYTAYLTALHEKTSWVSSLKDIDGEITVQGGGAVYYSFYKDLLRAPTLGRGIVKLANNSKTIPLKTINAVQQLSLFPEILTSIMLETVGRHGVDPIYFYLGMIFGLQGVYLASLFVTSWIMSGTCLAGLLAAGWFIINRTDTTRIEESVPLRENWVLPFLGLQVAALTWYLRHNGTSFLERLVYMLMCATSYISMIMWEYSHYLLFVQAFSLCLLDGLSLISKVKVYEIYKMYMAAVFLRYLLLSKNSALLTSPLLSLVIAAMIAQCLKGRVTRWTFQVKMMIMMYFCFPFILAAYLNLFIGNFVTHTGNYPVLQALKAKFGLKMTKNFTVNWLLCQESFRPLSQDCILRLTQSSLLPVYILVLIICLISMAQGLLKRLRGDPVSREITPEEGRVGERPEVIYHVVQSLILGLLAMNFEGLKCLWTPYVCVIAGFGVCSPALWITLFKWLRVRTVNPVMLAFLLSATVPAVLGFSLWREFLPRMANELSELEEYESDTMEVMNWIKSQTPKTAVIAASPLLMGEIKLCTGRMVASLPVYNDEELMRRNEHVYQIYSMKSAEEIYKILTSYKANYIVIEESTCNDMIRTDNCRVKDLLDTANDHVVTEEDGYVYSFSQYGRFCQEIKFNRSPYVNYFTRVYWNRSYFIYEINAVIAFQS
ncbi:putative C-mannosyltransferase DPY19L4 [Ranitomeya variabilis]|uniref:putative C-mannosyltransferase DPY19L4 n=1 Tax=Ranitomeya variabilis TaxID=490064 RepID=UPI00405728EC